MSDKQVSNKNAPVAEAKPAPSTVPKDPALAALMQATAVVTGLDLKKAAGDIQADVQKLREKLTPQPPQPVPDHNHRHADPQIGPFLTQQKLDLAKADIRYDNAQSAAVAALEGELNNWKQAVSQYHFAMNTAHLAVTAAVKATKDSYALKHTDSNSRSLYLFYTMAEEVDAAVQAYEVSAASAATALAAEAGNLLAAHATFRGSIAAATSTLMTDQTTAAQTFWQGAEQANGVG
ncbi:hypothetical protein [Sphingomonas bacterium]|uniref:hypothetical protein n=1 Tax=Sphingomonas bacterium TaxID=1895847 RepID=UPI00261BF7C3|nr:hypothetical protein [Sphingomonas bacterium]MDB5678843.1 hypothetical protein [Sphingomonas bacterium]